MKNNRIDLNEVNRYAKDGKDAKLVELKEHGTSYEEWFNQNLSENETNAFDAGYVCAMDEVLRLIKHGVSQ